MNTAMLRLILVALMAMSGFAAVEMRAYSQELIGPWHKDPAKKRQIRELKNYCLANPSRCDGIRPKPGYGPYASPRKAQPPKKAAIRDAVILGEYERKRVQEGLQALGHYNGAIDGSFGDGTRKAIRSYQNSIAQSQNGSLSAVQVKTLMLAGPYYSDLEAGDDKLFEAEFVMDLDRDEIRDVQRLLGEAGHDAGTPDGAIGRRTRGAVSGYKNENNLGGPDTPTKMLLARLAPENAPKIAEGEKAGPDSGGQASLGAGDRKGSIGEALAEDAKEPDIALVEPAPVVALEILGVRMGVLADEIREIAADEFDGDARVVTADADAFNGGEILSFGMQVVSPTWPEAFSSQLVVLFDEAFPEYGTIAVFRTIALSDGMTVEAVEKEIIPQILKQYGDDGKVPGKLVWISDKTAWLAAETDPDSVADCGSPGLAIGSVSSLTADDRWDTGSGPRLHDNAIETIGAKCGDVLRIELNGDHINLALWNSDYIFDRMAPVITGKAEGEVPKLKF